MHEMRALVQHQQLTARNNRLHAVNAHTRSATSISIVTLQQSVRTILLLGFSNFPNSAVKQLNVTNTKRFVGLSLDQLRIIKI
jgi:hypothetical protein